MFNAIDGKDYDFKRDGNPKNNDRDFHHRGSKWGKNSDGTQVYATARDAGNYAAGYIAGLKGLSWNGARMGFDGLELLKSGNLESLQSTLAQKLGHNATYPNYYKSVQVNRNKQIRSAYPYVNQGVVPFR